MLVMRALPRASAGKRFAISPPSNDVGHLEHRATAAEKFGQRVRGYPSVPSPERGQQPERG